MPINNLISMEDADEMIDRMKETLSEDDLSIIGAGKDVRKERLEDDLMEGLRRDMESNAGTVLPRYPHKLSDGEIAFMFEDEQEANLFYDFFVENKLIEAGEILLEDGDDLTTVHILPNVIVTRPELVQAALLTYGDIEDARSFGMFEDAVNEVGQLLFEKAKTKMGGAFAEGPGNPYHDTSGKFSNRYKLGSQKKGSVSKNGSKMRVKAGKGKLTFVATKLGCGNTTPASGRSKDFHGDHEQNVCWSAKKSDYAGEPAWPDGAAGAGIARGLGKRVRKESLDSEDRRYIRRLAESYRSHAMSILLSGIEG